MFAPFTVLKKIENIKMAFFQFTVTFVFLICSWLSPAQTEQTSEGDKDLSKLEFTNAQAIKVENLRYPRNALRNGKEGWVILS